MGFGSHITRNFQITIPKEIRKALPFLMEGDPVEFRVENDRLMIIPQKKIPADQAYYWTSKWQKGIKEARKDIKTGKVLGPYEDAEEGLKDLKKFPEELE
ncbi:MAG: AbrB/MazE/SpoVT family DNA-binding domain-containing protein [Armatimonadetes bacterium]|nr:AbrB/MazE/SpoVT family DNA-binding domain-containing protein [Armatimonadota bacterium]